LVKDFKIVFINEEIDSLLIYNFEKKKNTKKMNLFQNKNFNIKIFHFGDLKLLNGMKIPSKLSILIKGTFF